jgi:transglutaminase-like putative cysteine protease
MLEARALRGKCADLNALFVALLRAEGIPARDVYGIRVAPSALGYASLGKAGGNVTTAQHCRAEFHLPSHGWVPADPADVRKVILGSHRPTPWCWPRVGGCSARGR